MRVQVETGHDKGPRGDYYDWCMINEDGYLEIGHEEGNYAGGTTPSNCWYDFLE